MKKTLVILAVITLVFTVIILAPPLNVDVHVICDSDMGFFIKKTTSTLIDGSWVPFCFNDRNVYINLGNLGFLITTGTLIDGSWVPFCFNDRNVYINLGNLGFLITTGILIIGLIFYLCITKLDNDPVDNKESE